MPADTASILEGDTFVLRDRPGAVDSSSEEPQGVFQQDTRSADAPTTSICVLVVDDDDAVRSLFATLLREAAGVSSVLEARDGAEAVELGREHQPQVAVLDLNMPRLDGVEAALRLRALQPSMRIALHSSDPELLRARAAGLGLLLFDKVEFERLVDWVERQARR